MKTGLVFGKFMPLHKGHLALIEFALKHCTHLTIILCYTNNESIKGETRDQWLRKAFENNKNITIIPFEYNDSILPNTSASSKEVSRKWAAAFKKIVPDTTIVFTSELYGRYIAENMNIQCLDFDNEREAMPVSASQIRKDPFKYWSFIPLHVRSWFVKKICIAGTESTGKSTLTENLARHFKTTFVPEMAREIVEVTDTCTYEDLLKIASLHAKKIVDKLPEANKLLLVDTDINITGSYSEFLFNKKLEVENWIEEANQFDMHLFLEPDCEYIQDGTRLSPDQRNKLGEHHKCFFQNKGINFISIYGSWENRFVTACKIIEDHFGPLS